MDYEIEECTEKLVDSIRNSSDYRRYLECEEALEKFPGVFDQVMELRKKTIELYQDPDNGNLMENSDELGKEYERLEKLPEVNAFLEAEEDLVRILNNVSASVVNSVKMRVPKP
ncbi:YlbF family regulator [Chordicoccus furentiruminis]|jgi:cell fate (sporulation/competence/biofilm development) regulator YlbF (YheA/YmcA/DUF963 family)|uniref:YlbF family regulator n=1 Tax=Chordicoccus furentiruminis TaxID=2709410 RepID=UPI0023A7CB7B|nr:YlbF family regulator [Chordicoccus furentiruminis]